MVGIDLVSSGTSSWHSTLAPERRKRATMNNGARPSTRTGGCLLMSSSYWADEQCRAAETGAGAVAY